MITCTEISNKQKTKNAPAHANLLLRTWDELA